MSISIHDKWGNPYAQALRANSLAAAHSHAQQRGAAGANPLADSAIPWQRTPDGRPVPFAWHGAEWMHARSPDEQARLRDRFESFVPRMASAGGPSRAQEFFNGILPPGATLAPSAGGGYRQALQHHAGMRRQGSPYNLPAGGSVGGSGGGNVFNQTQRPYNPEFESPDRQNYPIHRNLANIYWRLFYKLDAIIGNGVDMYCLPAGEQVLTPTGSANIEDLRPGDEVLAPSGGVQRVERYGRRHFEGDVITVRGVGVLPFRVTDDHPVFVHRGSKVRDQRSGGHGRQAPALNGDFEQAKTLRTGDYLKLAKPKTQIFEDFDLVEYLEPSPQRKTAQLFAWDDTHLWNRFANLDAQRKVPRRIPINGDLCELFGWYAAEGSRTRVNVTFSLNANEVEYAERITELAMRVFDLPREAICHSPTTNNGLRITICSAAVSGLFRQAGEGSENKRVPEFVLFGENEHRRRFLAAYLRGDGGVTDPYDVKASSVSRTLASQVQLIGLALGVFLSVTYQDRQWRCDRDQSSAQDAYFIRGPKSEVLPKIFGEVAPERAKVQPQRAIEVKNHWLVPILKIEREEWNDFVYDIKTPEHAFCLPAVVHNSELPWGDVEFTGEGIDGEVKDMCEEMWEICAIRALLPYFVREYLVIGEAAPHCFYDKNKRMWTYVGMHNPDQLEVIYTPFVKMDPIVRFKPDNRLQQVLSNMSPQVRAVRESIPPELLHALISGQAIELHPLNFTFLPRKMHPYDVRGTSIISRMWRALMYEDAIFNASIATARRHAGPIKVAKLGDRASGWIPDPSHEQRLLELLAQAELDPHAWIVYHYGIEFDMVGTTDRVMTIDKHWELIERIKLIALGISKAFLHGEVTYASAASGLTVFLQRLMALREHFETSWILPKFFKPVAVMNKWIKPTPAELAHGVRTRRSHNELLEDNRYITPELQWARQLDPSVEQAKITAITALKGMGVVFSKQYLSSFVGVDWEEQLRERAREAKTEADIMSKSPELQTALMQEQQAGGGGGGGGGAGVMPGLPPETLGFEGPPGDAGAPPGGGPPAPEAGVRADAGDASGGPSGHSWRRPELWKDGRCGNWEADVVLDLLNLFDGHRPEVEVWEDMVKRNPRVADAARLQDLDAFWEGVETWLIDVGYPSTDIMTLEDILRSEKSGADSPSHLSASALEKEAERIELLNFSQGLLGAP